MRENMAEDINLNANPIVKSMRIKHASTLTERTSVAHTRFRSGRENGHLVDGTRDCGPIAKDVADAL